MHPSFVRVGKIFDDDTHTIFTLSEATTILSLLRQEPPKEPIRTLTYEECTDEQRRGQKNFAETDMDNNYSEADDPSDYLPSMCEAKNWNTQPISHKAPIFG